MKFGMILKSKFFWVSYVLIVLLFSGEAYSQMTYAKQLLRDGDAITIPSRDGGYVSSAASAFGQTYGWVKKTNGLGQRVFENELYFENDEFELPAMSETTDGGYVSVGGNLGYFGVTIKFAPTGEIQWKKKWISTDGSNFSFLRSAALYNGGFVAAGNGSSSGSSKYIVLAKFNSSGVVQSASKITLPNDSLELTDFVAATDGGFFLVSYTSDHKVSVIRLDGRTRILWSRLYEINLSEPRIATSQDNGAVLTGVSGDGSLLLLRLNINGRIEWKKQLSFGTIFSPKPTVASDDGYLITGTLSGPFFLYMFLVKTDLAGETVFAKHFPSASFPGWYYGSSAFPTLDGGYLLTGTGEEDCRETLCKSQFFFKLNSNGNVPGCDPFNSVEVSSDDYGEVNITIGQILRSSLSIAENVLEGTSTPSQTHVLNICISPLPSAE